MAEHLVYDLLIGLRDAIRREVPRFEKRAAAGLGSTEIDVSIGDEELSMFRTGERLSIARGPLESTRGRRALVRAGSPPPSGEARVRMDRATLVRLVEGETSIIEAAESGEMDLRGHSDEMQRLHDAFRDIVEGAVRTDRAPQIWATFRNKLDARDRARAGDSEWRENSYR